MKRWIPYGVAAAVVVTVVLLAARPFTQRVNALQSDLDKINADTGDVMASATYQRFAARREAVAAMRYALLAVARAESIWMADSGRPTSVLRSRDLPNVRSDVRVTIQFLRDRWVATAAANTTMTCSLTAMLDTVRLQYHPAMPVCAEWSTAESLAAVAAEPPAAPPASAIAVVNPAPAAPRKQRDWGPVNNTPPPTPYIAKGTCQGEGCTSGGTWAACSTVVARKDQRHDAAPVFTIQPGERFTALSADVHVDVPGMVVFRHPYSTYVYEQGEPVDIRFTPADTLFVLNYIGEGAVVWWFRGQAIEANEFWGDDPDEPLAPNPTDTVALVRRTQTVWWVHVRNAAGKEGWIVGDYSKMATGGYMDEIERCLHTAKG